MSSKGKEGIVAALATNPYLELITHRSVAESQKFRDENQNIVNPYQKPILLYLQLLKMFALPGSLIFDATCGSGSLELAAMEPDAPPDLSFIAFDKNAYQADKAVLRWSRSVNVPIKTADVMLSGEIERQTLALLEANKQY